MKAYVTNLHETVDEESLYQAFQQYQPDRVEVLRDSEGHSRACAFVYFYTQEDLQAAVLDMDGSTLAGRPISVEPILPEAEPRQSPAADGASRNLVLGEDRPQEDNSPQPSPRPYPGASPWLLWHVPPAPRREPFGSPTAAPRLHFSDRRAVERAPTPPLHCLYGPQRSCSPRPQRSGSPEPQRSGTPSTLPGSPTSSAHSPTSAADSLVSPWPVYPHECSPGLSPVSPVYGLPSPGAPSSPSYYSPSFPAHSPVYAPWSLTYLPRGSPSYRALSPVYSPPSPDYGPPYSPTSPAHSPVYVPRSPAYLPPGSPSYRASSPVYLPPSPDYGPW